MRKFSLLIVALLLTVTATCQQTYTFAKRDTVDLLLDVYQPASPRPDKACVLFVFGGAFISGERNNKYSTQCCKLLAERGFVAVSIDYRLYLKHAPKTSLLKAYTLFDTAITQAVEDCSDAIAFLCSHAEELNIDTAHIVLTGSSAGAITVLQTDYCRANSLHPADALPAGFRPAAVVPYAGGIFCGNNQLHYLTPPAPTCFFHGIKDKIVDYKRLRGSLCMSLFGSHNVAKVFKRNNYPYWILRYPGMAHEIAAAMPYSMDEFCAFVDAAFSHRQTFLDATCTDSAIEPVDWARKSLVGLFLHL